MPSDIAKQLKNASREYRQGLIKKKVPKKRKWLFIKGKDRRETKYLERLFLENNPGLNHRDKSGRLTGKPYPDNDQQKEPGVKIKKSKIEW